MAGPPIKMTIVNQIVRCVLGLVLIVPSFGMMLLFVAIGLHSLQHPGPGETFSERKNWSKTTE